MSTSDLRPAALRTLIGDTITLAKVISPDPFRALADPGLFKGQAAADLQLEDPGYDRVTTDEGRRGVENRSAGRLLSLLTAALQGSSLQQKRSFLEGKHGQKLFRRARGSVGIYKSNTCGACQPALQSHQGTVWSHPIWLGHDFAMSVS